ncbi:DUF6058 family natural product biosynthesis protein [Iodobacter arcticus]|uniref:DUF6058 family natural product biosynthesis protein n=1 Tax=Iodobacter arcticus TaxID=590593 RepID=A0ABW2QX52_9NEIS
MSDLDFYLTKYYLNTEQFASACNITVKALNELLQARLIPAPSYIVTAHSTLKSYVFGEMAAPDATPAHYFHPENTVWTTIAQQQIKTHGIQTAFEALKASFISRFQAALKECNHRIWPLKDSFNEDSSPIALGLETRSHAAWEHFLQGTFGLCVAYPVSEAAIAEKEVLQEKLNDQSNTNFTEAEIPNLLILIDAFAKASMPFSPIDYPFSSRKRLVDDFRLRLKAQPFLTIRPMTISDAAAVSALLPTLGYSGDPSEVASRFTLLSAQPDQIIFLALQNNQLAGLCHAQGVRLIASNGYAEINALVVNTALQRRGIGKALVSHAKDWAQSQGYERLRLRSGLHRKNAHLFYEAIGFSKKQASYAFETMLSTPL